MGAESHLAASKHLSQRHAEVWLSILTQGVTSWLDKDAEHAHELPLQPVSSVLEMAWTDEQQAFLLDGMVGSLLRLLNEADLGDFYHVHHELGKLFKDTTQEGGTQKQRTLHHFSDENLLRFCRTSAERVARWSNEGRRTNDLAYVHSLSGDTTVDLIALTFENAADRDDIAENSRPSSTSSLMRGYSMPRANCEAGFVSSRSLRSPHVVHTAR